VRRLVDTGQLDYLHSGRPRHPQQKYVAVHQPS